MKRYQIDFKIKTIDSHYCIYGLTILNTCNKDEIKKILSDQYAIIDFLDIKIYKM